MHLSRLYINNFRSIKELDVSFCEGKNVIIGRNNAGKSNIIKAINLVLGEGSPTWNKSNNISEQDFFKGDRSQPIYIWCQLETNHDLISEDFARMYQNCFGFKVITEEKYSSVFSRTCIDEKSFSNIDSLFELSEDIIDTTKWIDLKKPDKGDLELLLSGKRQFAFVFTAYEDCGHLVKDIRFLVREDKSSGWIVAFRDNLRNELLQSAIIPSFRDPKDQLRINNWSWYGKLLKKYVNFDDRELQEVNNQHRIVANRLFSQLQDTLCSDGFSIAFPNTDVTFQLSHDSTQDLHKSAVIYVDDGFKSELTEKGAGIQSAVIISLFDFYVREVAHSGSSLLAIEEPELYLHPHGRRVISDRLNKFLASNKNQVIVTSHSSEFITTTAENLNIIVISKDKTSATVGVNMHFNDVKEKQLLIRKENAEIYFADAVILTEDAKCFIQEIAKLMGTRYLLSKTDNQGKVFEEQLSTNWLNEYNVSVINCGGKSMLPRYAKVLKQLNIPYFIISDFDFLRDGGIEQVVSDQINLATVKSKLNTSFEELDVDLLEASLNKIKQFYLDDKLNEAVKEIKYIHDEVRKRGKSGNYKRVNELDVPSQELITELTKKLQQDSVYLLSGELEDMYKPGVKLKFSKEQKVLYTLQMMLEDNQSIEEYINTKELETALTVFIKKCLGITLKECVIKDQVEELLTEELPIEEIPF